MPDIVGVNDGDAFECRSDPLVRGIMVGKGQALVKSLCSGMSDQIVAVW